MKFNYVSTGIQLIGTKIQKLEVDNNIINIEKEAKRSFSLNINEPHFEEDKGQLFAQMVIDFEVQVEQTDDQTMTLEMSLEGAFVSDEDAKEEEFKKLVAVNGAAAIIGIARGKIETLTANIFNDGKVVIPFINVVEYYKSMIEQSKE